MRVVYECETVGECYFKCSDPVFPVEVKDEGEEEEVHELHGTVEFTFAYLSRI